MPLNLHLLRMFTAVATHRSFTQAAKALSVSQSAISKGVREFEAQVGTPLLERQRSGITLTVAGTILMRHTVSLFAAERAAEADLRALLGLARGELHVGASTTIGTYIVPQLIRGFQASYPKLELRLTIANTRDIAQRLMAREIDAALIEAPHEETGFTTSPWVVDKLVVVASPSDRLAHKERLTKSDLAGERHIVRELGSGTRAVVEAALSSNGIEPESILEVGSTEAIKQFVVAGLGIAVVSYAAARDQIELGSLVVLSVEGLEIRRPLFRLAIAGRPPSPAAESFDAFICEDPTRLMAVQ